ncbi:MAG: hypothetical protein HYT73_01095 [Candidatus Aenigmarchaeota archaeon]|nr:hypothetical protein [Candidatus Aenigmarchaeota archaeon]
MAQKEDDDIFIDRIPLDELKVGDVLRGVTGKDGVDKEGDLRDMRFGEDATPLVTAKTPVVDEDTLKQYKKDLPGRALNDEFPYLLVARKRSLGRTPRIITPDEFAYQVQAAQNNMSETAAKLYRDYADELFRQSQKHLLQIVSNGAQSQRAMEETDAYRAFADFVDGDIKKASARVMEIMTRVERQHLPLWPILKTFVGPGDRYKHLGEVATGSAAFGTKIGMKDDELQRAAVCGVLHEIGSVAASRAKDPKHMERLRKLSPVLTYKILQGLDQGIALDTFASQLRYDGRVPTEKNGLTQHPFVYPFDGRFIVAGPRYIGGDRFRKDYLTYRTNIRPISRPASVVSFVDRLLTEHDTEKLLDRLGSDPDVVDPDILYQFVSHTDYLPKGTVVELQSTERTRPGDNLSGYHGVVLVSGGKYQEYHIAVFSDNYGGPLREDLTGGAKEVRETLRGTRRTAESLPRYEDGRIKYIVASEGIPRGVDCTKVGVEPHLYGMWFEKIGRLPGKP